jgi:hypothetical protein
MKTAAYYLESLNNHTISWEEVPISLREEVLELSAKIERQKDGFGGGYNQPI